MSYKDTDGSIVFPTRAGEAQGAARERTLIANAQGAHGTATRTRKNPDGSETLLKTRAGNPDFITTKPADAYCTEKTKLQDYGFVDTKHTPSGVGDETSGKLQILVGDDGAVIGDAAHLGDTHAWKDRFLVGVSSTVDGISANDYGLPSNYSGLMRRVMQVVHGTSEETKSVVRTESDGPCTPLEQNDAFSCYFSRSDGMFIDSFGVRWIIEVSATGVFRIPITFNAEFSSPDYKSVEDAIFASLPDDYATAAQQIAEYWTVKSFKRSSRVKIADAPLCYAEGYTPWYAWCGWAFNYTGTKATIALSRQHPTEASWYQAAMFDMTIISAGDNSVPTYVTYEKTYEGPLATSINDYDDNHNAFIQAPIYPGICQTVGLFSPVPVGGLIYAPVFSFYEESGQKREYFVETFDGSSGVRTSGDYGGPTTITVSRVGTWTYTTGGGGDTQYPISEVDAPYSYTVACQTEMNGIYSRTETGTYGGWAGISSSDIPSHNVDRTVSETYVEMFEREHGYGKTGSNGLALGGTLIMHSSVLSYSQVTPTVREIFDCKLLPFEYQTAESRFNITARVDAIAPPHGAVTYHNSTIVLTGYDRESAVVAFSRNDYEDEYTVAGSWTTGNYARVDGGYLYSRINSGVSFSSSCSQAGIGAIDWCLYGYPDADNYPTWAVPSIVQGAYTFESHSGYVFAASRLYTDLDCSSFLTVTPVSEYHPAGEIWTRTLNIRVGGELKNIPMGNGDIHQTLYGGNVLDFWAGASAFKGRAFFSPSVNTKPEVHGVGSYVVGMNSLFGFIGVF